MMKKTLLSLAVAASFALGACGGGGGNGGTGVVPPPPPPPPPPAALRYEVNGPVDAVQDPMSGTVFGGLIDATAGTPLEPVLVCADYVIAHDTLDVVDTLAVALQYAAQNPNGAQAALTNVASGMTASVNQLAADLQGLLNALASTGGCGGSTGVPAGGALGTNPLAGTPLEPLGTALAPLLAQFPAPTSGITPAQLVGVITQLNAAYQSGLAAVPAQARNAPVIKPLLTTISIALNDLEDVAEVMAAGPGAAAQTADRVATLVDHALTQVMTGIVPVGGIEFLSGVDPIFSAQIVGAVHELTGTLEGQLVTPVGSLEGVLSGGMLPLAAPFGEDVLAPILGAVSGALAAGGIEGGVNPFEGSPLEALGVVLVDFGQAALSGAEGGTTGTPIDLILEPILDAVETGGVGACPVGGTPLAGLCTVADSVIDALALNPLADPLAVLTGAIEDVLDLLGLGDLLGGLLG